MLPMRLRNSAPSATRTGASTAISCGGMLVAAHMNGYLEGSASASRIVQPLSGRYAKMGSRRGTLAAHQIPAQRRTALNIAYCSATEDCRQMFSMQTVVWPNGTYVFAGECLTVFHIFHHKQRPPEYQAGLLRRARSKPCNPQSPLGKSHRVHHRPEFIRLERERAVRPVVCSR